MPYPHDGAVGGCPTLQLPSIHCTAVYNTALASGASRTASSKERLHEMASRHDAICHGFVTHAGGPSAFSSTSSAHDVAITCVCNLARLRLSSRAIVFGKTGGDPLLVYRRLPRYLATECLCRLCSLRRAARRDRRFGDRRLWHRSSVGIRFSRWRRRNNEGL